MFIWRMPRLTSECVIKFLLVFFNSQDFNYCMYVIAVVGLLVFLNTEVFSYWSHMSTRAICFDWGTHVPHLRQNITCLVFKGNGPKAPPDHNAHQRLTRLGHFFFQFSFGDILISKCSQWANSKNRPLPFVVPWYN